MTERSGGHLLVVDDNGVNRLVLGRYLQQQGHRVVYAENGRQALDLLHAQAFDMMLLDIEMPEMNGYQVLEHALADARLRDIPILVTSALDEMDSVVECIQMGAEDYLTKRSIRCCSKRASTRAWRRNACAMLSAICCARWKPNWTWRARFSAAFCPATAPETWVSLGRADGSGAGGGRRFLCLH